MAIGIMMHAQTAGFNVPDTLFEQHTSLNIAAIGFFLPLGLWIQKQRQWGSLRTYAHSLCAVAGVACLWAAGLAIWTLKGEYKKDHLTTYHSWLGVASASLLTLQLVLSALQRKQLLLQRDRLRGRLLCRLGRLRRQTR